MEGIFWDFSIEGAVLMLQLSFFFSVISFVMCLILFYKRHKDEVSRRIPVHEYNPFEDGKIVGEATEYPTDENSPVGKTQIPTSTPYFIVVKNTTNEIKRCNLFGLGINIFSKNFGSDEGITIEMGQSNVNYLLMLIQSAFQPFETELIRLQSRNLKQLTEKITITSKEANGQSCHIPLITANYVRPDGIGLFVNEEGKELNESDEKHIDIYYQIKIDMSTDLDLQILPNTELKLIIYPMSKFNPLRSFVTRRGYTQPFVQKKEN